MAKNAPDAPLQKRAYTIQECIAVSGFNRTRVYTLINQGALKTFRSGRRRFVSAAALDACIARLEKDAG